MFPTRDSHKLKGKRLKVKVWKLFLKLIDKLKKKNFFPYKNKIDKSGSQINNRKCIMIKELINQVTE